MADMVTFPWLKELILGLVSLMLGVFGWIGKRQVKRIDDLEEKSVNRGEYNDTIKRLSDEIKTSKTEITDRLDNQTHQITQRLDSLMLQKTK